MQCVSFSESIDLSKVETQAIQRRGANARALGSSLYDNPYYKPENLPGATGDNPTLWNAKCQAWAFGWKMENFMR